MRAFLVFLLFCIHALFGRWYYVCQVKQLCGEGSAIFQDQDIRLQTLQLRQGDTIFLEGYDQFLFNNANVPPRLNADNNAFLDTLANYLESFPQKNLTITGLFRPSEDSLQAGMYENMGVARADAIRKLLIKRGIAEERVSLDYSRSQDSLLREPLAFNLYVPSRTPSEFEKVQFSFTNMTFSDANFASGSDEFRPGEAFTLYADSLKTYLNVNPDKQLTIMGHTDNVGADKYNVNLGLRRGRSTRTYLQNLGINSTIKVDSRGEKRPVASNETEEGRQKNRRVNFVLE